MHTTSDIDLFLVRPDDIVEELRDQWDASISALAGEASAWTGNDTRVLEMNHSEVRNALAQRDPVLDSIRAEEIRLFGSRSFWRRLTAAS